MAVLWDMRSDTAPRTGPRQEGDAGMRVYGILTLVMALLQRERRVSSWALKQEFGLDDAFIEGWKQELIVAKRVAMDEGGQVLVWTGEVWPPATPAVVQSTSIEAAVTFPPPAQTLTPHATPTATPANAPTSSPDPVRQAPEAERRQVTVLFCDLVDSTKLSQHLDAEDYRAVVRAYQQAAVTAMQPWDGYVAQYLGDGLLVYFGWPTAHEDAAVRAVHASLAHIAALEPLNTTQLAPRYGVRVQVRLGLHTGMAVIGDMGSGDRHEQLAMGDTPNIAARLQGLADPDT